MTEQTSEALVAGLVKLLEVEMLDTDYFRGIRQPGGRGRVFGGQVIAQALASAIRTMDGGRVVHSLHANFLRGGDETVPILFRVARDFDGRSFAARRVVAIQHDRPILTLTASFQKPEPGLAHQDVMPDVAPPEALRPDREVLATEADRLPDSIVRSLRRIRPIELRSVEPRTLIDAKAKAPFYAGWFRTISPVADGPDVHRAILAYATDMMLLPTSLLPHGVNWATPGVRMASLDHAVWFHATPKVDEWLLYVTDSPWAAGGRGFNRGRIFSRDGVLVASVAQEGLIRYSPED